MVEDRVGYQLKRAQHALRLAADAGLRMINLTMPQYAALSVIEAIPGISGAALARHAFVTAQTINAIVTLVAQAGLVERRRHPEHGRIVQLYLTAKGVHILQEAHQVIGRIEAQMVAQFTDAEQQQLVMWLQTCSEALEQVVGEGTV